MDSSPSRDMVSHSQVSECHLSPDLTSSDLHRSMDSLKLARAEVEVRKCLGDNSKETILKSYSCAWQKELLVQGRMYLTHNWFCFYANILGWETKTSIKFSDVTSISKQRTALVFPNAILIEVGSKKYGFASVVHRDKVFHVLGTIWRNALSPSPLIESVLLTEIHNWKQSSKQLPSSLRSNSLTADGSDTDHHTPHNHHTLTTSTQEEDSLESDSLTELLGDHTDGYFPTERSSTSNSDDTTTGSTTSGGSTGDFTRSNGSTDPVDATDASSTQSNTQQRINNNSGELQWFKHDLRIAGLHKTFGQLPFINQCTTTLLINMLLVVFIILLLGSTLTMLCRLSQVEPSLHPYLILQPWCRLCSETIETLSPIPHIHH